MMKKTIKKIIPEFVQESHRDKRECDLWVKRGCLGNAPQFVKQSIFIRYGIPNATWVETGTYLGTTTNFLEKNFGNVYTVEPSIELHANATKRFLGRNIEVINGLSETVFPELIPKLSGNCNFWLDGHYSGGVTFEGESHCPIPQEFDAIEANLENFDKVAILVDDIRLFIPPMEPDYPSIDWVVDWARKHNFTWCIEHDILIMRNFIKTPRTNGPGP